MVARNRKLLPSAVPSLEQMNQQLIEEQRLYLIEQLQLKNNWDLFYFMFVLTTWTLLGCIFIAFPPEHMLKHSWLWPLGCFLAIVVGIPVVVVIFVMRDSFGALPSVPTGDINYFAVLAMFAGSALLCVLIQRIMPRLEEWRKMSILWLLLLLPGIIKHAWLYGSSVALS